MIPSNKWFPSSLQDRAAWYANFQAQMASLGASLGFSVPEIASIGSDNSVMEFLGSTAVALENYEEAVRAYRRTITEGEIGDPAPSFPADISPGTPTAVATGIYERLDGYVKRIRAAAAFTEETGATLGINPAAPITPIVGTEPPVILAFPQPGGEIDVKFAKNGSAGIFIQTNVDLAGWTNQGRFFRSPANFVIPANEGHTPSSVQIQARFLVGNDPVGDWSSIVTVQTKL